MYKIKENCRISKTNSFIIMSKLFRSLRVKESFQFLIQERVLHPTRTGMNLHRHILKEFSCSMNQMNIINLYPFRAYKVHNVITFTFHSQVNVPTTSSFKIRIKQSNTLPLKHTSPKATILEEFSKLLSMKIRQFIALFQLQYTCHPLKLLDFTDY